MNQEKQKVEIIKRVGKVLRLKERHFDKLYDMNLKTLKAFESSLKVLNNQKD